MKDIYYHLKQLLGISLEVTDSNLVPYDNTAHNTPCFCTKLQEHPSGHAMAEKCRQCKKTLLEKCQKSGELTWHSCPAGLTLAMMPIRNNGNVEAYLTIGPLRVDGSQPSHKITDESLIKYYTDISCFSHEKLSDLKRILPFLILPVNYKTDDDNTLIKQIINYIQTNIHRDLRLSTLCETFHISKNQLYKLFSENRNTTVNEYIIQNRIKIAKKMLQETPDDVCVIAVSLGFKNPSYFSNFFKKYTGISPNQYRKQHS